jgi:signal recognition particle GTPase
MSLSSIHKIFNDLVVNKKIEVKTETKLQHENLRTRLVKLFSEHKKTLKDIGAEDETSVFSLCGSFDSGRGISTFKLAKKRGAAEYEVILEDLDTSPAVA